MYYWEDYSSLWRRAAKTGKTPQVSMCMARMKILICVLMRKQQLQKRYNLVPVKHKSSICLTMLNYFK